MTTSNVDDAMAQHVSYLQSGRGRLTDLAQINPLDADLGVEDLLLVFAYENVDMTGFVEGCAARALAIAEAAYTALAEPRPERAWIDSPCAQAAKSAEHHAAKYRDDTEHMHMFITEGMALSLIAGGLVRTSHDALQAARHAAREAAGYAEAEEVERATQLAELRQIWAGRHAAPRRWMPHRWATDQRMGCGDAQ